MSFKTRFNRLLVVYGAVVMAKWIRHMPLVWETQVIIL